MNIQRCQHIVALGAFQPHKDVFSSVRWMCDQAAAQESNQALLLQDKAGIFQIQATLDFTNITYFTSQISIVRLSYFPDLGY